MEKRKKELEEQLESLKELEKKELNVAYEKETHEGFASHMNPIWKKIQKVNRELNLLRTPIMSPIPEYGSWYTLEDFRKICLSGGFIDYDGNGNYSTEKEMSDIEIVPSDIKSGIYRKDFTHVIWFNK